VNSIATSELAALTSICFCDCSESVESVARYVSRFVFLSFFGLLCSACLTHYNDFGLLLNTAGRRIRLSTRCLAQLPPGWWSQPYSAGDFQPSCPRGISCSRGPSRIELVTFRMTVDISAAEA